MKTSERDNFTSQWKKYFNQAELPISFYYTDEEGHAEKAKTATGHRCIIADLHKVRRGQSLYFDADTIACYGAKRFLGFTQEIMPNFEYFLSCGIPGKLEGERYKKSPELVLKAMESQRPFISPGRFIVFKRWDQLAEHDEPQVVIFFGRPDVLAGLFTLANFDQEEPNGVIAPFGSGCSTIVFYPYFQIESSRSKAVMGMLDISARPYVTKDEITFAAPMGKFQSMINNMDESFLITESWKRVQKRID
jgi:uncharacterized protein (DUF169 family)